MAIKKVMPALPQTQPNKKLIKENLNIGGWLI